MKTRFHHKPKKSPTDPESEVKRLPQEREMRQQRGEKKGNGGGGGAGADLQHSVSTAVGTTPSVVSQIITEGLLS